MKFSPTANPKMNANGRRNLFDHISAVTKIVGGISLVHSILDFIPILIKMNLYRWVFIDINTRQFTFYTVMYID